MKIGRGYAGDNRQAMTRGETLSLWAAYGIMDVIGLPGDRHHCVAQNPPHCLGWQAPQGIFQITA